MVCDFDHAAIFKVSQFTSSGTTVSASAEAAYPKNCTIGLGYRPTAPPPIPTPSRPTLSSPAWHRSIGTLATISGPRKASLDDRCFVGACGAGGPDEIVAGVTNLRITYREAGRNDFGAADVVGDVDQRQAR